MTSFPFTSLSSPFFLFFCLGICQFCSEFNDSNILFVCFYCSYLFRRMFVGKKLWESKDERKWGHDKFEEITVQERHYEEVKISSSCLIVELALNDTV